MIISTPALADLPKPPDKDIANGANDWTDVGGALIIKALTILCYALAAGILIGTVATVIKAFYVAQERLQSNNKEFSRTPMHTNYFVNNLIYGDKVYSHPLASWELNNTYVTAIELRNKYPHESVIHLNHEFVVIGYQRAFTRMKL